MNCPSCGQPNASEAKFCQSCGERLPPATESAPTEVRKTVSVVFCDLKGSTSLGESVDPETLRNIIARYFDEMRSVIERHGGLVEKFIGDAVMGAFGIPTLHEDDALRAVRAAFEMQQKMQALGDDVEKRVGVRLGARIGVNTGEVIAGDPSQGHGFVAGDAVNVAARLEQAAGTGEVLIGRPTFDLVRDAVKVEQVEPLELKGKTERVPAYRLVSVDPYALGRARRLDSPLVGREAEMSILREALDGVIEQKSGGLVTVLGNAGAGKSRLTEEFMKNASGRALVIRGRCLPYGEGITFWPVAEAIRSFTSIEDTDDPATAIAKIGAVLSGEGEAELVRDRIAAAIGLTGARGETQETFWAVRRFLEAAGGGRPVLFVVDDIHWAEPTMLDLIEYLAGYSGDLSLMLLCLSRPELRDTRPSWGANGRNIPLQPLTEDAVRALIENLLGRCDLPEAVASRVVAAAEGNPLYVEEILRMLIDDGLLVQTDGVWRRVGELDEVETPPSIHALIAARIDRLNAYEKSVIQRAAVIGQEFWWGAVVNLAPEDLRSQIAPYIQSLVRKELTRPTTSSFVGEDALRFSHILIRDAAYNELPKSLRAPLHEAFADWLEHKAGDRINEYQEILGYHLEQSYLLRRDVGLEAPVELAARAGSHLAAAGRRAAQRGDSPAAANLLGRAVDLLPSDHPDLSNIHVDLVQALVDKGDFAQAQTRIDAASAHAAAVNDECLTSRMEMLTMWLLKHTTELEESWAHEARAAVERVLPVFERAQDASAQVEALRLLADSHWFLTEMGPTAAVLTRALELAQANGLEDEISGLLAELTSTLYWGPTPAKEAALRCEQILELVEGHPLARAKCLIQTAGLLGLLGLFDAARSMAATGRRLLQELGQTVADAASTQITGEIEMLAGDYERAESEYRSAFDTLTALGDSFWLPTSAAFLAKAMYARGRTEEAASLVAVAEKGSEGDRMSLPDWAGTKAKLMASSGDGEAAIALAREAVKVTGENDDPMNEGNALLDLAEVLLTVGQNGEAATALQRALELYRRKQIVPSMRRAEQLLERATAT